MLPPFRFEENQLATKGIWKEAGKTWDLIQELCATHTFQKKHPLGFQKLCFLSKACEEAFML